MLLYLDNSITQWFPITGGSENVIVEAIDNLTTAHREGYHFVTAERTTIDLLLDKYKFSLKTESTLKDIRAKITQFYEIINEVYQYVNVCYREKELCSSKRKQKILHIPIEKFADFSTIQKSKILCENLNDYFFYILVCKTYMFIKRFNYFHINFQPIGCGGSNCFNQYQYEQNNNNCFCICIVDSDKKGPTCRYGNTAIKTLEVDDDKKIMSKVVVLECREVENMLPTRLLSSVSDGNQGRLTSVKILDGLENSTFHEFRRFLDMKNGMTIKKLKSDIICKDSNTKWIKHIKTFINDSKECSYLDSDECHVDCNIKCLVFPGFGPNILENCLKALNTMTIKKISENICKSITNDWTFVAEQIFSWGCSMPTNRI